MSGQLLDRATTAQQPILRLLILCALFFVYAQAEDGIFEQRFAYILLVEKKPNQPSIPFIHFDRLGTCSFGEACDSYGSIEPSTNTNVSYETTSSW